MDRQEQRALQVAEAVRNEGQGAQLPTAKRQRPEAESHHREARRETPTYDLVPVNANSCGRELAREQSFPDQLRLVILLAAAQA